MTRRTGRNKGRGRKGEVAVHDDPTWEPLYEAVGPELAGWFMWMAEVRLRDGHAIHIYKHSATRRSLHLDEEQQAWFYGEDGLYRRLDLSWAIRAVFASWRDLGATPGQLLLVDEAWERALDEEDRIADQAAASKGTPRRAPATDDEADERAAA